MADYRELDVWKRGRELTVLIYRLTELLPETEKFGLRAQMQRAAISVPANIAEGAGRGSDASFGHFVRIAIGSLNELETLLYIATDVGLCSDSDLDDIFRLAKDLSIRLRNLAARLDSDAERR